MKQNSRRPARLSGGVAGRAVRSPPPGPSKCISPGSCGPAPSRRWWRGSTWPSWSRRNTRTSPSSFRRRRFRITGPSCRPSPPADKLPDIVSLQSLRAPGFADLMVSLDERIKADKFDIDAFDPSIIKGLSRNGKQFALPYDFGPWVIYYNHDMFDEGRPATAAPGWTEADFMRDAKALTKDGTFGFAVERARCLPGVRPLEGCTLSRREGSARPEQRRHEERFRAIRRAGQPGQGGAVAAGKWCAVVFGCQRPLHLRQCRHVRRWTVAASQHQEEGRVSPLAWRQCRCARPAASRSVPAPASASRSPAAHKDEAWKAIQVMTGPEAETVPRRSRPCLRGAQGLPEVLVRCCRGRRCWRA